jgi:hypothetical protein
MVPQRAAVFLDAKLAHVTRVVRSPPRTDRSSVARSTCWNDY